jgi:uncharacterized protein
VKVLYHADCADGFTAAWVAWRKYGETAEYIPVQYGSEPPSVAGAAVLILDFSYPRAVLERMHAEAQSLTVIDHHKTAAADLAGLDYAVFDMERSGAGLAWDELIGTGRPALVDYVEDRDLWRWKLHRSHAINAYIGLTPRLFDAWDRLANELAMPGRVADLGDVALRVTENYVDGKLKSTKKAFIGGYWVRCVNTTFATSETVGALAEGQPFAAGWFQKDDGSFVYSLRSREGGVDVSEVAKEYGGGGHRNAAGFAVKELLK